MIDLESMSKEELRELEKRLKAMDIHEKSKRTVMEEECAKFGIHNYRLLPYDAIFMIADDCTNNYTKKKVRNGKIYDYRNSSVPDEIMDEYRRIVRGILGVMYSRK